MRRAVPVDEKLARGLTMAEVRAILKAGPAAGSAGIRDEAHPVRAALKPAAFRYATGRRPDPGYLAALVARFDAHYGSAPGTVCREVMSRPTKDGDVAESRRYLTLTPSTDDPWCRSLLASCVCLDVRRKCLMLIQVPLCEVELHAIERFHLRTRSGLVRDALAAFGADLLGSIGLYRAMSGLSDALPNKAFAMPFADGLLLGHACGNHPAAVPYHALVQFFGDEPDRHDRPLTGDPGASCRVATFLGPLEMSPAQVELREALLEIARSRAAHLQDHADALTYPPAFFDRVSTAGMSVINRFDRDRHDMEREVRRVIERPGMERALGPGRVAPVVRPPPRPEPEARRPKVRYHRRGKGPSPSP